MRFLRTRRGDVELARTSDRHDAIAKGRALDVLGDAVILVRHPYERDPQSGSGNCWCARAESSSLHDVILEPARAPSPTQTPGDAT